jgi:phosphoribosylformylglycinamidine cyclo-ligase
LKSFPEGINGIAHITGGSFYDKISRILPKNIDVNIQKTSWPVPKIFGYIQNKGNIADREMFHTLNMGIGLVLIVKPGLNKKIIAMLAKSKLKSWVIGKAVRGSKKVNII